MFTWLRRLWWGQYSLPIAFWAFGLGGMIAAGIIMLIVYLPFILVDLKGPGVVLALLFYWGYAAIVFMGIWRSADAYMGLPAWALLSKGAVLVVVGGLIYRLASGGFERLLRMATQ